MKNSHIINILLLLSVFFCGCAITSDYQYKAKEDKIIQAIFKDIPDAEIISKYNIKKKQIKTHLTGFINKSVCNKEIIFNEILINSPDSKMKRLCLTAKEIQSAEIFLQSGHYRSVNSVSFSSDGKYIASGSRSQAILWDIQSGTLIRTFKGHLDDVVSVVFSPDGRYIASGGDYIKIWNVKDGSLIRNFKGYSFSKSVCFSPDGKLIASGNVNNTVTLLDTTKDVLKTLTGHLCGVTSVVFSPDGQFIASGSYDNTIKLWNVKDRILIKTYKGHTDWVNSVRFSPDGRFITSLSSDETIKLWNIKTGTLIKTFKLSLFGENSFGFSPDGKRIVSGCSNPCRDSHSPFVNFRCINLENPDNLDENIKVWNILDGNVISSFKGNFLCERLVRFSPDGKSIVSVGCDNSIKLWDFKKGKIIKYFNNFSGENLSVTLSPDGNYIALGHMSKSMSTLEANFIKNTSKPITLWNIDNANLFRIFKEPLSHLQFMNFSPDGRYIASVNNWSNEIYLWNVKDGTILRTIDADDYNCINSISFNSDSKHIVSGGKDKTIKLWNIKNGNLIRTIKGHSGYVNSVSFSPDGKFVVSGSSDDTIKLWNTKDGTLIWSFKGHSLVKSVSFSPNGRYIVSCGFDNTIKLWNLKNGTLITTFEGHSNYVHLVCFSPDGNNIASASWDHSIKLWDVENGVLIRTFKRHPYFINSVKFSTDGKYIVSGDCGSSIIFWNVNDENDYFIYAMLPNDEWISFKSGQPYYNSSINGDKYAAIRFNNDTFNYEPLSTYKNIFKRTNGLFQSDATAFIVRQSSTYNR